jgi:hypothetical protein
MCTAPEGVSIYGGVMASTFTQGPGGGIQAKPWIDAPGSLWIIAAGGATWQGTELAEGRIYAVDDNCTPKLTRDEYSAWIGSKSPCPVYGSPDTRHPPLATVKPGERLELLLPAKDSKGAHKVRLAGSPTKEGWIRGTWDTLIFLKRKGSKRVATANPPPVAKHNPKPGPQSEPKRKPTDANPWEVHVTKASLEREYRVGLDQTFQPKRDEDRLAVLEIEFKTSSGMADAEARLQPAKGLLTDDALDFLRNKGKLSEVFKDSAHVLAKPARLFLSKHVELVLPDETRLSPELAPVVLESDLMFFSFRDSNIQWGLAADKGNPVVIRSVAGPGLTAALVQPEKAASLTLIYVVPAKTARAKLRFYDCPPIDVSLAK